MVELSLLMLLMVADKTAAAPAQAPADPPAAPDVQPAQPAPSARPAKVEAPGGEAPRLDTPVPAVEATKLDGGEATKLEVVPAEGTKVPASVVQPPRSATASRTRELLEVVVPVRLVARNMMGRRFRLVEARFVLGGTEVLRKTAPPGQELDVSSPLMVVPLRRGEHALTATFVFHGRNLGPFSYLGNYRYRVEQTYSFYLEKTDQQPIIEVVAREQGGLMVPLERRPSLEVTSATGSGLIPMTGITHGTQVTVVR